MFLSMFLSVCPKFLQPNHKMSMIKVFTSVAPFVALYFSFDSLEMRQMKYAFHNLTNSDNRFADEDAQGQKLLGNAVYFFALSCCTGYLMFSIQRSRFMFGFEIFKENFLSGKFSLLRNYTTSALC